MGYTLGQAARAVGCRRPRYWQGGRISGIKDEFGQLCIEPCGLHRVYLSLPQRMAMVRGNEAQWESDTGSGGSQRTGNPGQCAPIRSQAGPGWVAPDACRRCRWQVV